MSKTYILISIIVLAILAIFVFYMRKSNKPKPLTNLTKLAFLLIFLGIIFGDSRYIGYSLMGAGVLIAVIDIIKKFKKK